MELTEAEMKLIQALRQQEEPAWFAALSLYLNYHEMSQHARTQSAKRNHEQTAETYYSLKCELFNLETAQ